MTVRDRDRGAKRLIQNLERGSHGQISIGVHGTEASFPRQDGGLTVGELAEIHEFGLGHVPPRSWLGGWFDEREDSFPQVIRIQLSEKLKARQPLEVAFKTCAVLFQASIQQRFTDGIPPELADETIRRKGSSTPLIDTGVLRSSVLGKYELK